MPSWEVVAAVVAVAVIPVSDLGKIMVAVLAKKAGVKPGEIREYQAATGDGEGDG